MIFNWLSSRRRKNLLDQPPNQNWLYWIADNVWHWHVLSEAQRRRLGGLVRIFVTEKNFEGCNGLALTDEIKVTIAAAACVLLVGFNDTYCFDRAKSILVYPAPMVQRNLRGSSGVVDSEPFLAGMASQGGTIVLSWRDVLNECRDEQSVNNVVIHEFAHHVDGIDGAMEGIPPLPSPAETERWTKLANAELKKLRESAQQGLPTVLDPYGATNLAELFAVATEAFFCDGRNLSRFHPEMYEMLAMLYAQQTKDWFHEG
jgi:MtfA peptidase